MTLRLVALALAVAALAGCANQDPGAAANSARTNQAPVVAPIPAGGNK